METLMNWQKEFTRYYLILCQKKVFSYCPLIRSESGVTVYGPRVLLAYNLSPTLGRKDLGKLATKTQEVDSELFGQRTESWKSGIERKRRPEVLACMHPWSCRILTPWGQQSWRRAEPSKGGVKLLPLRGFVPAQIEMYFWKEQISEMNNAKTERHKCIFSKKKWELKGKRPGKTSWYLLIFLTNWLQLCWIFIDACGLSLVVVHRLLTAVATPVAEHEL